MTARRTRSSAVETEMVNPRILGKRAVKRQHIDRWAVGHNEIAPGVVGATHVHPTLETRITEIASGSGVGQLLQISATNQSFTSGGDYVTADAIVYQHGFDDVTAVGDSIVWPHSAIGLIQVEFAWNSYTGGGRVEIEVDGVVPPWGLVGDGVGRSGKKERGVDIAEGSVVKIKVTQSSGSAQVGDAFVEFYLADPAKKIPGWQLVETVWLETLNSVSASTVAPLSAGQSYRFRIEGNYDQTDTGVSGGDAVIYPSTGASTDAGRDAEVSYVGDPGAPFHLTWFTIDLGSGASHVEPVGGPFATPAPEHTYEYLVTGEGSPVTFRHGDDVITDNNGQFKIDIYKRASAT